ncbi:diacylglycerol kinase family protein [Candidatus Collierbacteria bacterium]|nr:diacylglycerol kinase family protein [Candidatus Collierbacteria bacterium]
MKLLKPFAFALEGLGEMISGHNNFKVQLAIGTLVVFAGIFFQFRQEEWMVLILAIGLVLAAEMANSAIEAVVDLITKERKLDAKKAKDIAAGMVLLASGLSIIIGIFLFGPRLLRFL